MTTQTIATHAIPHHGHRRGWLRFIGHFVEMVVVMLLGMGVLSAVLGMPHGSAIEIQALYMAATMTVPMIGWMLLRGHSRQATAEMAAAMVLPMAALFPMHWASLISGDAVIDLQHVLMLPAMLGAMLGRRREYGL
jgi:hypothetical protein